MKGPARRNCLCCKEFYRPDHRNLRYQRYCSKPACRKESKAQSQRRWLQRPENENYFRGPENSRRVKEWRKRNPGYRRKKKGLLRHRYKKSARSKWLQMRNLSPRRHRMRYKKSSTGYGRPSRMGSLPLMSWPRVKAVCEFRKFTDKPPTLRGGEYAAAVQALKRQLIGRTGYCL
jgi:hypothetical protein